MPFLCVIVIFINQELIKYGSDLHVGTYEIINRVVFLFAMAVMGLNHGMRPMAGSNYGTNQIERVNKVLKYPILLATLVITLGFLLGELIPRQVVALFTKDETLTGYAVNGLRIFFMFCPVINIQMVTANFFQRIGMAKKSIFMSLSRQLIFLLPGLIIMSQFFGVKGVWYSLPVVDILSGIVVTYMLLVVYRKSVVKH